MLTMIICKKRISSLAELNSNFVLSEVWNYACNGRLQKWLTQIGENKVAEKLDRINLSENQDKAKEDLMKALGLSAAQISSCLTELKLLRQAEHDKKNRPEYMRLPDGIEDETIAEVRDKLLAKLTDICAENIVKSVKIIPSTRLSDLKSAMEAHDISIVDVLMDLGLESQYENARVNFLISEWREYQKQFPYSSLTKKRWLEEKKCVMTEYGFRMSANNKTSKVPNKYLFTIADLLKLLFCGPNQLFKTEKAWQEYDMDALMALKNEDKSLSLPKDDGGNVICRNHEIVNAEKTYNEETLTFPVGFSGIELSPICFLTMVKIPAGSFMMGPQVTRKDDQWKYDSKEKYKITFSNDFYCSKSVITLQQWKIIQGIDIKQPVLFKGRDLAENDCVPVCWRDANAFCFKLNERKEEWNIPAEYEFSLLTEAEWEYAARGGDISDKSFDVFKLRYGETINQFGVYGIGLQSEWCSTPYCFYPKQNMKNPSDPDEEFYCEKVCRSADNFRFRYSARWCVNAADISVFHAFRIVLRKKS